jgi:hypothetical protein
MKNLSRSALLLSALLALQACKPDEPIPPVTPPPATTGTLRITVVPEWEGVPFERFVEYRNFMDYRMTVELLKFYFGDVRLVNGADSTLVKDVELFDLGNGPTVKEWTVPVGSWSLMHAALGVPAELNFADPANYGPGHPLNVSNGTFWTWASGYRYVVFEGRYDEVPTSTATLISSYAIHPGMEPSYLEFDLVPAGGITVTAGNTTNLVIKVAVDRFFHSNEYEIDLATENSAHGNNVPLQLKLVNNVIKSMTLE